MVVNGTWLFAKSRLLSTHHFYSHIPVFSKREYRRSPNLFLVVGACCNWQPNCLPNHWNGFKSRRLHCSLNLSNRIYWYRSERLPLFCTGEPRGIEALSTSASLVGRHFNEFITSSKNGFLDQDLDNLTQGKFMKGCAVFPYSLDSQLPDAPRAKVDFHLADNETLT